MNIARKKQKITYLRDCYSCEFDDECELPRKKTG